MVWVLMAMVGLCLGLNGGYGFRFLGCVSMATISLCLGFNGGSGLVLGLLYCQLQVISMVFVNDLLVLVLDCAWICDFCE